MGRKPNAIVTEFFNRGAKLHDSSNRYEHTCKLCGQNFPKGRSDSLLGHLTKTCPAISTQDRTRVQSIWPGTADRASKRSRNNAGVAVPVFQGPGGQFVSRQKHAAAAFNNANGNVNGNATGTGTGTGTVGELHGLNVLAEASRQVGAAGAPHHHQQHQLQHPHQQQTAFDASQLPGQTPEEQLSAAQASQIALVDPALEASNKHHDTDVVGDVKLDLTEPHAYFASADGTVLGAFTTAEALGSIPDTTTATTTAAGGGGGGGSDTRQTSQLSLIAASANEMVHQDTLPSLEPDVQLLLYRDSLSNDFYQSPPAAEHQLHQDQQDQQHQEQQQQVHGLPSAESLLLQDETSQHLSPDPSLTQAEDQTLSHEQQQHDQQQHQPDQQQQQHHQQEQSPSQQPPLQLQFDTHEQPTDQPPSTDLLHITSEIQSLDPTSQRAALYPRPIAIQPSPAAGTPVQPNMPDRAAMLLTKAKGRSQFTEERRREVQLVRQLGACLRCRMLKKTLDLERQTALDMYPGRIEASHFFDSEPLKYLTFSTFMGFLPDRTATTATTTTTDIVLKPDPASSTPVTMPHATDFAQGCGVPRSVYVINTEADNVETKLDQYMKNMAFLFYETEPSHVIKSTLVAASQLSEKTEGGDELLDGVLQLWIATRIITDPNFRWKLSINQSLPSPTLQPFTTIPDPDESSMSITDTSDPESYTMITTQLRAGAEKCAEKLSKSVLNKIEQRLLQKQRAGQFRTFLGALVLINCAERMTWLYQAYQNDESLKWPLDLKPEHYVGQGERFASIVSAHLKMRSLAPASIVDLEDLTLRATDTDDEDIINWFYSINMTYQYLQSRELAMFDPSDCRSLDLKYGLKLFRPPQNEGVFAAT
ncbi:hypothetical protein AAP_05177 [Ascosphaera apis ARSEF 7405]|uniref:Uncharacterized protein n=1 Tax=Ascosphaera apis ARSEF 7405 TaxID=392613 RepID=A0A167VWW0_9EURO|nr:hypothetical protein AAP_05177 [Ascosphaera apis ARSEF 7405]